MHTPKRTYFVYEDGCGLLAKATDVVACFASLAKCDTVKDALRDLSAYYSFVVIASTDNGISEDMRDYLISVKEAIVEMTIGVFGIGSDESELKRLRDEVGLAIGREADCMGFVSAECVKPEGDVYTDELLDSSVSFMSKMNVNRKAMEPKELKQMIDEFIAQHDAICLACASDDFVRNTPLDFKYCNGCFYLVSEGGLKFRALLQNPNVCLALFDSYKRGGSVTTLQVTGKLTRFPIWSDEYVKALEESWNSVERHKKSTIRINVLKIVPEKYEFFSYNLKKTDYDLKQVYIPDESDFK